MDAHRQMSVIDVRTDKPSQNVGITPLTEWKRVRRKPLVTSLLGLPALAFHISSIHIQFDGDTLGQKSNNQCH